MPRKVVTARLKIDPRNARRGCMAPPPPAMTPLTEAEIASLADDPPSAPAKPSLGVLVVQLEAVAARQRDLADEADELAARHANLRVEIDAQLDALGDGAP